MLTRRQRARRTRRKPFLGAARPVPARPRGVSAGLARAAPSAKAPFIASRPFGPPGTRAAPSHECQAPSPAPMQPPQHSTARRRRSQQSVSRPGCRRQALCIVAACWLATCSAQVYQNPFNATNTGPIGANSGALLPRLSNYVPASTPFPNTTVSLGYTTYRRVHMLTLYLTFSSLSTSYFGTCMALSL